jgi:PAS domain S-box-containing protein
MSALSTASSTVRRRIDSLWPTTSLRTYLIVVILLATLPIASLMAYWILTDVQGRQRNTQLELQQAADSLARTLEREFVASIDALAALAAEASIQRHDIARFEEDLRARRSRASWFSVYLLDGHGGLLFDTASSADSSPRSGGADSERDTPTPVFEPPPFHVTADVDRDVAPPRVPVEHSARHFTQRSAQVSNLIDGRQPGQRAIAIEIPVVIDGQPRYSLGAWITAPVWQRIVQQAAKPPGSVAGVYDRERSMIARSGAPAQTASHPLPKAGTGAISAASLHTPNAPNPPGAQSGGDSTLEAWKTVAVAGWGVNVDLATEPLNARRELAIGAALATGAACIALGVLLALLMARRLTRPLRLLATTPQAQASERIVVREVAQLRDALLDAKRLEKSVHARLKAKRDLLQNKANEFEALFAGSPIGLAFAQDPACTEVLYNAAMTALFGPPHASGSDPPMRVLHQGQLLERHQQPLQRAAAHGECVSGMELELQTENQPPRHVLVNAVPLSDNDGRPRGALSAVVDITERKQGEARLANAERNLRESQRLIDLAQEVGSVGFFHYLFDADALTWTPGLSRLFGLEPVARESTLNFFLGHIFAGHRERIENTLRRAFSARWEREVLEFRVALPGDQQRWLSSRIMIIYADDGRPLQMTGVTLDINDQKDAERGRAALIQREYAARVEAEAANRAKDEFLAMLGHELRNPLSAIAAAIEVLNRVDATGDKAASARGIIARQTRHLARLMDDLLDVARVIAGKILLTRQHINLASLVERLVATIRLTGGADQHELNVELNDAWIEADVTRIEQVVNNLLTNALKYTPAGGRIDLRVGLRTDDRGERAELEVRDTGVGIPPALLPKIFDLFVQAERALDRRAGGLGIGLTLVRRLVELHGGTVAARSSPAGTVFTVRLPAVKAPPETSARTRIPASRRRHVAVIEDNEDALESLRQMLELDGHTVYAASDGVSGLATLLEQRPEVAVVDIGLPGLTGLEVAKRSRAAGYAGRMIALSGYSPEKNSRQALAAGFDAYMVKPVNAEVLRRALDDD